MMHKVAILIGIGVILIAICTGILCAVFERIKYLEKLERREEARQRARGHR